MFKVDYEGKTSEVSQNGLLPWVGGFFDGEGAVVILKLKGKGMRAPRYQLGTRVGNTNRAVIEWLRETFNGGISTQYLTGPKKPCHHWIAGGPTAAKFLKQILPYLKLKRKQAELGLQLQDRIKQWPERQYRSLSPGEISERETIYQQLKILNGKGKAAFNSGLQLKAAFDSGIQGGQPRLKEERHG